MIVMDCHSEKGMRSENQDSYLAFRGVIDGKKVCCAVVADGMGGSEDGTYASQMLVRNIAKFLRDGLYGIEMVDMVARTSHKHLLELGRSSGTTLTCLFIEDESEYSLYHVGDSRCYAITYGVLTQISEDHSVREDAKRGYYGNKSPEMVNYPKNMLSRCIGLGVGFKPFIARGQVAGLDGFLLCSDGFWHTFNGSLNGRSVKEMCKDAIFNGENDNVTAVYVGFGGVDRVEDQ